MAEGRPSTWAMPSRGVGDRADLGRGRRAPASYPATKSLRASRISPPARMVMSAIVFWVSLSVGSGGGRVSPASWESEVREPRHSVPSTTFVADLHAQAAEHGRVDDDIDPDLTAKLGREEWSQARLLRSAERSRGRHGRRACVRRPQPRSPRRPTRARHDAATARTLHEVRDRSRQVAGDALAADQLGDDGGLRGRVAELAAEREPRGRRRRRWRGRRRTARPRSPALLPRRLSDRPHADGLMPSTSSSPFGTTAIRRCRRAAATGRRRSSLPKTRPRRLAFSAPGARPVGEHGPELLLEEAIARPAASSCSPVVSLTPFTASSWAVACCASARYGSRLPLLRVRLLGRLEVREEAVNEGRRLLVVLQRLADHVRREVEREPSRPRHGARARAAARSALDLHLGRWPRCARPRPAPAPSPRRRSGRLRRGPAPDAPGLGQRLRDTPPRRRASRVSRSCSRPARRCWRRRIRRLSRFCSFCAERASDRFLERRMRLRADH